MLKVHYSTLAVPIIFFYAIQHFGDGSDEPIATIVISTYKSLFPFLMFDNKQLSKHIKSALIGRYFGTRQRSPCRNKKL